MPVESAIELEEAHKAMIEAKTPEEQRAAAKRYVEAERKHLRRVGVPVEDRSVWSQFLPVVLLVCLLVTMAFGISNSKKASGLAEDLQDAQYATCLRGNESLPAQVAGLRSDIRNLRADTDNLRADLDLLHGIPIDVTSVLDAKRKAIISKERAIEDKRATIAGIVASRETVAIRPGSVKVDCDATVGH